MKIEGLRVVDNDKLETPEGDIVAPVVYYMDLAINEQESVAVSIGPETYSSLHTLFATGPTGTATDPATPMGVPA